MRILMISDQDELKRLWQQPLRLFRLSNALREKSCQGDVSFVINRNINFTNECTETCRFFSFKHGIVLDSLTPEQI